MSLVSKASCRLGRHEPDRNRVRWDGQHYTGTCRHCDQAIYRVRSKTWRKHPDAEHALPCAEMH